MIKVRAKLSIEEEGTAMSVADPYRPCENPACLAVDSTHCAFRTSELTGNVVPSQQEAAKRAGCRVVRFLDETTTEARS